MNNIILESSNKTYLPQDILVIVPHCLQNDKCVHKITNGNDNCKKCGACDIGEIINITKKSNINLEIVTGGTAARNVIKTHNPKLIISVACERDLLGGIMDVGWIPVLGLVNERPNGPCFNTKINILSLNTTIEKVIRKVDVKDI